MVIFGQDEEDDYQRGYKDGQKAASDAREQGEDEDAPGDLEGSGLSAVESIINESMDFGESQAYQEGFRKGVEESL